MSLWALGSLSSTSSPGWAGHRAPAAAAGALGSGGRKKEHPRRGEQPEPPSSAACWSEVFSSCSPAVQRGRCWEGLEGKLGVCEERRCHHREVSVRVGSGDGQSGAVLGGTRVAAAPPCSPHVSGGGPDTLGEFPFLLSAFPNPFPLPRAQWSSRSMDGPEQRLPPQFCRGGMGSGGQSINDSLGCQVSQCRAGVPGNCASPPRAFLQEEWIPNHGISTPTQSPEVRSWWPWSGASGQSCGRH